MAVAPRHNTVFLSVRVWVWLEGLRAVLVDSLVTRVQAVYRTHVARKYMVEVAACKAALAAALAAGRESALEAALARAKGLPLRLHEREEAAALLALLRRRAAVERSAAAVLAGDASAQGEAVAAVLADAAAVRLHTRDIERLQQIQGLIPRRAHSDRVMSVLSTVYDRRSLLDAYSTYSALQVLCPGSSFPGLEDLRRRIAALEAEEARCDAVAACLRHGRRVAVQLFGTSAARKAARLPQLPRHMDLFTAYADLSGSGPGSIAALHDALASLAAAPLLSDAGVDALCAGTLLLCARSFAAAPWRLPRDIAAQHAQLLRRCDGVSEAALAAVLGAWAVAKDGSDAGGVWAWLRPHARTALNAAAQERASSAASTTLPRGYAALLGHGVSGPNLVLLQGCLHLVSTTRLLLQAVTTAPLRIDRRYGALEQDAPGVAALATSLRWCHACLRRSEGCLLSDVTPPGDTGWLSFPEHCLPPLARLLLSISERLHTLRQFACAASVGGGHLSWSDAKAAVAEVRGAVRECDAELTGLLARVPVEGEGEGGSERDRDRKTGKEGEGEDEKGSMAGRGSSEKEGGGGASRGAEGTGGGKEAAEGNDNNDTSRDGKHSASSGQAYLVLQLQQLLRHCRHELQLWQSVVAVEEHALEVARALSSVAKDTEHYDDEAVATSPAACLLSWLQGCHAYVSADDAAALQRSPIAAAQCLGDVLLSLLRGAATVLYADSSDASDAALRGYGGVAAAETRRVHDWLLPLEELIAEEHEAVTAQPEVLETALLKAFRAAEAALHFASGAGAILAMESEVWEALQRLWQLLRSPAPAYDNPELLALAHSTWHSTITFTPQSLPASPSLQAVKHAIVALEEFFSCFVSPDHDSATPATAAIRAFLQHPSVSHVAVSDHTQLGIRVYLLKFLTGASTQPPQEDAVLQPRRELLESLTPSFEAPGTHDGEDNRMAKVPRVIAALLSVCCDSVFLQVFRQVAAAALQDGGAAALPCHTNEQLRHASPVFGAAALATSSSDGPQGLRRSARAEAVRREGGGEKGEGEEGEEGEGGRGDILLVSLARVSSKEVGRCLRAVKHLLLRAKGLIHVSLSRKLRKRLQLQRRGSSHGEADAAAEETEFLALLAPVLQCLRLAFDMREALLRLPMHDVRDAVAVAQAFVAESQRRSVLGSGEAEEGKQERAAAGAAPLVDTLTRRCVQLLQEETAIVASVVECRRAEEATVNALRRCRLDWSCDKPVAPSPPSRLLQVLAPYAQWRLRSLSLHLVLCLVPYVAEWRAAAADGDFAAVYDVASYALQAWGTLSSAEEAVDSAFADATHRELAVTIDEAQRLLRYYLQRDWLASAAAAVRGIALTAWGDAAYGPGVGADDAIRRIMALKEYFNASQTEVGAFLRGAYEWLQRVEELLVLWTAKDEYEVQGFLEGVARRLPALEADAAAHGVPVFPLDGVAQLLHSACALFLRHARFTHYTTAEVACLSDALAQLWSADLPDLDPFARTREEAKADAGKWRRHGSLNRAAVDTGRDGSSGKDNDGDRHDDDHDGGRDGDRDCDDGSEFKQHFRMLTAQEMLSALQSLLTPSVLRRHHDVNSPPLRIELASSVWRRPRAACPPFTAIAALQRRIAALHSPRPVAPAAMNAWIDVGEVSEACRRALGAGHWKALSHAIDELCVAVGRAPPLYVAFPRPQEGASGPLPPLPPLPPPFDLRQWVFGALALYRRVLRWATTQCAALSLPVAAAARCAGAARQLRSFEDLWALAQPRRPGPAFVRGFLRPPFSQKEVAMALRRDDSSITPGDQAQVVTPSIHSEVQEGLREMSRLLAAVVARLQPSEFRLATEVLHRLRLRPVLTAQYEQLAKYTAMPLPAFFEAKLKTGVTRKSPALIADATMHLKRLHGVLQLSTLKPVTHYAEFPFISSAHAWALCRYSGLTPPVKGLMAVQPTPHIASFPWMLRAAAQAPKAVKEALDELLEELLQGASDTERQHCIKQLRSVLAPMPAVLTEEAYVRCLCAMSSRPSTSTAWDALVALFASLPPPEPLENWIEAFCYAHGRTDCVKALHLAIVGRSYE